MPKNLRYSTDALNMSGDVYVPGGEHELVCNLAGYII
jgi:hypothetical protein